ncbi:MAG: PilZ domain-containing protein, partial [Nitrospirae bacterium]
MELRQSPRLRVRFRTSFSAPEMAAGEGFVKDISLGGCRVETSIQVHLGTEL